MREGDGDDLPLLTNEIEIDREVFIFIGQENDRSRGLALVGD